MTTLTWNDLGGRRIGGVVVAGRAVVVKGARRSKMLGKRSFILCRETVQI